MVKVSINMDCHKDLIKMKAKPIRRVEITFNDGELDLINYLDAQQMRTATFIKHIIRERMNGNSTVIDYDKIKRIINESLSHQPRVPIHKPKQTSNNQSKLLQNFSKKY